MFNLFQTKTDAKHQKMGAVYNYPSYLSHEDEPVDFYRKYTDKNFATKNAGKNSRNLFDDSNAEDRYWVTIARRYIARARL